MLHTMLDVREQKVVDLVPAGDPQGFIHELNMLFAKVTGQSDVQFENTEQAKEACLEALRRRFFTTQEPRRAVREYDTRPVRPPWLKEDGTPTHVPAEGEAPMFTAYRKEGPIAKAREIFERMWGSPRKDIIEACAKAGIKRSTAATQYQHFKKAKEMSAEYRNPRNGMPQLAPGTQVTQPSAE